MVAARPRSRALTPPPVPRLAVRAPDVTVEEVSGPRGRDEFVRFQLQHYASDPAFVPPIVAERRDFIDPAVNPFFENARAAFFLARRQGRVVGRLAAVVDSRSNRFHHTNDAFFGLFESQNDPGLAAALFETAADWARRAGVKRLLGPANLAFHHDAGMVVEGFERPPSMMVPYNPRYYPALVEANGFTKLKDLYTYEVLGSAGLGEKVERLAQRVRESGQVRVRQVDASNPDADIRRVKAIYETMLSPGFGVAPLTDAEFEEVVHRLRPLLLLRPELSLIAEVGGEAVAFAIAVPDTNDALKAAKGYLFPFGLARLLWAARKLDRLRFLLFGIKDGYRRRGIDALLASDLCATAVRLGYQSAEIASIVEDDKLINRTVQATGARRVRTLRIYQRPL